MSVKRSPFVSTKVLPQTTLDNQSYSMCSTVHTVCISSTVFPWVTKDQKGILFGIFEKSVRKGISNNNNGTVIISTVVMTIT